jgi:hypothetical protein
LEARSDGLQLADVDGVGLADTGGDVGEAAFLAGGAERNRVGDGIGRAGADRRGVRRGGRCVRTNGGRERRGCGGAVAKGRAAICRRRGCTGATEPVAVAVPIAIALTPVEAEFRPTAMAPDCVACALVPIAMALSPLADEPEPTAAALTPVAEAAGPVLLALK